MLTSSARRSSSSGSTSPTTSSTRSGRRRRERHADPVQRRLAGHPVRARSLRQMATLATVFYLAGRRDRLCSCCDARLAGAAGHRCRRLRRQPRLHGAAAQARLPRARRDRRRARLRAADAAGAYVVQTRGVLAWEPFVASIPIALLVALILYVNEIPDRRGDARAGKRTLPVRFSRSGRDPRATTWPRPRPTPPLVVGIGRGRPARAGPAVLLTIPLALTGLTTASRPTTTTRTG